MKYTYKLENLNCAHCASKIEAKIANTEGFANVSFNFATKLLVFYSEKENTLYEIQQICDSIEDGVSVIDCNAKCKSEEKIKSNSNKKNISKDTVFLILAAVLTAIGFIVHFITPQISVISFYSVLVCCITSTLLSGYKVFIKGFKSILKLRIDETTLMAVAVIAAFCLGEFIEAAMVTLLFSIGEIFEDKAVDASRRDIEKLAGIRPDTATIISDGIEQSVPAAEVKKGSIISVAPYERIPLDGLIVSGSTTIDTSVLTGESIPIDAGKGCEVLSGSINGSGLITIKTTKEFGDSTATRILKLVEEASAKKGQKEKLISRFASIYTPIVVLIAAAIAIIPPVLGFGAFSDWLYRSLVCLVASCPCAIVISVPLSYYAGIGAASKIGVLIKGGKYIETLAKSDCFIFDKTGTLTTGKLSVTNITSLSEYSEEEILALAAACEKHSVHPIASAILEKANDIDIPLLTDYTEKAGYGTCAMLNGKRIECGGVKILSEEQRKCNYNNSSVFVLCDGQIIGTLTVNDTIREESGEIIKSLKSYGVKNTLMLTGDSIKNAEKVSTQIGMSAFRAELLPSDKLDNVIELKKTSNSVCFVGDGINDAPVLSASDCGIAMGLGSEAAIEASDAVLASGTLKQLPNAIKISRKVINTVKTNIIFAITIKAAVIILAAFGFAAMWMSVIADTGVSVLCVLNAARLLRQSKV